MTTGDLPHGVTCTVVGPSSVVWAGVFGKTTLRMCWSGGVWWREWVWPGGFGSGPIPAVPPATTLRDALAVGGAFIPAWLETDLPTAATATAIAGTAESELLALERAAATAAAAAASEGVGNVLP